MPIKKKPATRKLIKKKTIKKPIVKKIAIKAKVIKRKASKPKKLKKAARKIKAKGIGVITHYFPKVRAAVVKLNASLSAGDMIKIKGHTSDFKQKAESIQIDRVAITSAKKGQEIGLQVNSRVRKGDIVYKA